MTIDKVKLKALAQAANAVTTDVNVTMAVGSAPEEVKAVQDFLQQAMPKTILALLAEIERMEAWRTPMMKEREALIRQRDRLADENEALRKALGELLALYEDDEGCRELPEYIAGREAMAKEVSQ